MTPLRNSPAALKATVVATRLAARVSPRLSGRFATRLWFTPWRLPLSPRAAAKQAEWLRTARPLELDLGALRLKGYEAGTGPTVLLVHGWGDGAGSLGRFVAPLTGAGYRVVAFDLPGHGETSGGPTDVRAMGAAVRAAGRELGPLHGVVAHSMGAVATLIAVHEGLEVERAFFVSPAVYLHSAIAPFARMFSLPDPTVKELRARIEGRFGTTVWTDYAADRLSEGVDIPTLMVHDPDDPQIPFADVRLLAERWSSADLETVRGVGHTAILRDRRVVDRAVAFLGGAARDESRGPLVGSTA